MSRRNGNGEWQLERVEWSAEEQQAIEQSLDMQMIGHVKELLCSLWKQSRISIEVRSMGDSALGAALRAVEQPARRNLTLRQGATHSYEQWRKAEEAKNNEF